MEMAPDKLVRTKLTREDWARAAFRALADGGSAAVAVESLAAGLGATKGSFYWHFRDRADLLDAALEVYEREDTEAVIAALDSVPAPLDRMRMLFVVTHSEAARLGIEAVMLAEAGHPQVGRVLRRITARRVRYMVDTLVTLGLPADEAAHRALLAYQAWIGFVQLRAAVPEIMPTGADEQAYLQHIVATLEAGWLAGRSDP